MNISNRDYLHIESLFQVPSVLSIKLIRDEVKKYEDINFQ